MSNARLQQQRLAGAKGMRPAALKPLGDREGFACIAQRDRVVAPPGQSLGAES